MPYDFGDSSASGHPVSEGLLVDSEPVSDQPAARGNGQRRFSSELLVDHAQSAVTDLLGYFFFAGMSHERIDDDTVLNSNNGGAQRSEYSRESRTPLALHTSEGEADLKVKENGQFKALSCMFYVATSRAGQIVYVLWNETTIEIFANDGEYIIDYPRPTNTGMYYEPHTSVVKSRVVV